MRLATPGIFNFLYVLVFTNYELTNYDYDSIEREGKKTHNLLTTHLSRHVCSLHLFLRLKANETSNNFAVPLSCAGCDILI